MDPIRHIVDGLLLHDKVVVPTTDFLVVPLLLDVFGERALLRMLAIGWLRFQRIRGWFGVDPSGGFNGIYASNESPFRTFDDLWSGPQKGALPFSAKAEDALAWAMDLRPDLTKHPRELCDEILRCTDQLEMSSLLSSFTDETGRDRQSEYVQEQRRELYRAGAKLRTSLATASTSGLRVLPGGLTYAALGSPWWFDDASFSLTLAMTNLEIYLTQTANCSDTSTANPIGFVLNAKFARAYPSVPSSSFSELCEIADVPDIAAAVVAKYLNIESLIDLRESRSGRVFRPWFHRNCRENAMKTGREYANLLKNVPTVETLPLRALRLIAVAAIGLINPLIGFVASAGDTFSPNFVGRWLGGNPKVFVQRLSQLQRRRRNVSR